MRPAGQAPPALDFAVDARPISAMLRAYGPGCTGGVIDPATGAIPDAATWIDMEAPTPEEEALVEQCVGVEVPTRKEMAEIEPSSRLYERNNALYLTINVLCGLTEADPSTTPVGFVLTDERLVTVRYATPKPIRNFIDHLQREPDLGRDSRTALARLLDAIIDRLADELEEVGEEIERISANIFNSRIEARRIPAKRLTALLTRIGRTQSLLAKIRYSAVSTNRMLSFVLGSDRLRGEDDVGARNHLSSLLTDTGSLSEHANFLSDNLIFLLDASLGLISVEQNAAMKLFSWAALIFLPPTLVAGIYGMNFKYMPELESPYGYPVAIALIIATAVVPILYLKRRGWI